MLTGDRIRAQCAAADREVDALAQRWREEINAVLRPYLQELVAKVCAEPVGELPRESGKGLAHGG